MRTRARPLALTAVCGGLLLPGCATNEKVKLAADGAPQYQNLQISYDLATTSEFDRLDQPVVEQTAIFEPEVHGQSPTRTRPWARRRVHLELQYPYPGIHPAFARATLRIVTDNTKGTITGKSPPKDDWKSTFSFSATSGGKSAPPDKKPDASEPAPLPEDPSDPVVSEEILYIDLPKTELDEVLSELAKADFFKLPSNPDGVSHLVVVFNKGRCEKGWTRDQRLDRLVELLRRHGAPLPEPKPQPKKA